MERLSFTQDAPRGPTARDDLHDVIIIPKVPPPGPDGEAAADAPAAVPGAFRFPIVRNDNEFEPGTRKGEYRPPEPLPPNLPGGRKVRSLAVPDRHFGPAFAVAPTRPEPAAQNGTCIIVNQEHVRVRNVWTAARLSQEPPRAANDPALNEPDEYRQRLPDDDRARGFELLVAGNEGKVYHVRDNLPPAELTDLGNESEIWYQLRNGFIAGSVYCRQLARVLPMVNASALKKVEE